MLPPDGLLDRARNVLKLPVSQESVEDVKQVSRRTFGDAEQSAEAQPTNESRFRESQLYVERLRLAILNSGYHVLDFSAMDAGFDLAVENDNGRRIYIEIKYSGIPDRRLSAATASHIVSLTAQTSIPILLITNMPLSKVAATLVHNATDVKFLMWRNEEDNDELTDTLHELFT